MSNERAKISTRKSFGQTLAKLGEIYPEIVCFDADLAKSTMSGIFQKKFPHRFFEMGIQEANMIGAAAGMSFTGKIPFICSFGAFLTGRFDQIRMSIGYSQANVKLIGTHSGVAIGEDGHSQMGLEDLALMRSIPSMVVLQPSTDDETYKMMEWAVHHKGPVYLRLTRQDLTQFQFDNFDTFKPGLFSQILKGEKTAFLASGGLLGNAYEAALTLHEIGKMKPSVYNASTIKPFSHDFMEKLSQKYQTFVVFEDHTIMGGLGSAVAEWMGQYAETPRRVIRYGVQDVFGESGTPDELYRLHKFTPEQIVNFFA